MEREKLDRQQLEMTLNNKDCQINHLNVQCQQLQQQIHKFENNKLQEEEWEQKLQFSESEYKNMKSLFEDSQMRIQKLASYVFNSCFFWV